MVSFVGEHTCFCAAAAPAFLAADLFDAGALRSDIAFLLLFDLVEQETSGQKTVEALLACGLAFDLEACRAMNEHDASGGFVDVLTAVAAGTDESFFDIRLAYAKGGHALGKLVLLFGRDGKGAHGVEVKTGKE